jgi:O-antigen/teichoic acid export membrane protein
VSVAEVSLAKSTASIVLVRALGVAARYLALIALASLMTAAEFAVCGLAFAISEFARCATDAGIDPVFLRKAEQLDGRKRRLHVSQATVLKLLHGALALTVVAAIVAGLGNTNVLAWMIAMQFFAQALVQLSLNVLQADNAVHRVARPMLALYLAGMGLASAAFFGLDIGRWALPAIALGELAFAAITLASRFEPAALQLRQAYRAYFPMALPMAGISFLALINTRFDSLVVITLLSLDDAGKYMYLVRWGDTVPMLAAGIAMPLLGKLEALERHASGAARRWLGVALALALLLPFIVVHVASHRNPAYASDGWLPWLVAATSSVRTGLVLATVALLSMWRDSRLLVIAAMTAVAIPLGCWWLGSTMGAVGIAAVVLTVEICNLVCQLVLIRRARRRRASARLSA